MHRNLWTCLVSIGVLTVVTTQAQPTQVGTWRDYLPYRSVKKVIDAGDRVYGMTPYSLLEVHKSDRSASRFSKVHGLTDVGITDAAFHGPSQTLLVGYADGNMDLIEGGEVFNIADIERASIIADKRINRFTIRGPNAYISCGFGIVQYNVANQKVAETFFIGPQASFVNVNDVGFYGGWVWAATDEGVFKALENSDLTLSSSWSIDTDLPLTSYSEFTVFNDSLYLIRPFDEFTPDSVYATDGQSGWTTQPTLSGYNLLGLEAYSDKLLICTDAGVEWRNNDFSENRFVWTYEPGQPFPNHAIVDSDNVLWIGDEFFGVVRSERDWLYDKFLLEAPYSNRVDHFAFDRGSVLIASGSRSVTWKNTFTTDGIFIKDSQESWTTFSAREFQELDNVRDYIRVIAHPNDRGRFFVGTLGEGVLEFEGGSLKTIYNEENSTLTTASGSEDWVGVTGLAFDQDDNLWVSNSITPQALSVMKQDGSWQSFNFSDVMGGETTGDIVPTRNGHIWTLLPSNGQGILVLDYGTDLENTSDDRWKILRAASGSGGLPSTNVYCMAEDQDGEIWVGTDQGVAVFFSPGSVFEENVNLDAQQILIRVNGFFQYLFETEVVTAIAVDPANRKWFGTESSGVFLMSEDGTEELFHFTEENSPLLSNTIRTIGVNPEDGEVLIGTDRGLIAFKGTATGGSPGFGEVYAYPNPVKPGYNGPIAIKGLARGSNVKITDINGNLVFETYAEGGQAIWNGERMSGGRASTGVYLVFALDSEGTEAEVTKILFVN